jgi:hypothetical protein
MNCLPEHFWVVWGFLNHLWWYGVLVAFCGWDWVLDVGLGCKAVPLIL